MPSKSDLIQNLTSELKPVVRLAPPLKRTALWVLPVLVLVSVYVALNGGARPGSLSTLGFNQFTFETLFALSALFWTPFVLFQLNVPGLDVPTWKKLSGFLPLAGFAGFLLYGVFVESAIEPTMAGKRHHCDFQVMLLSILPSSYLFYHLQKGLSHYDWKQFSLLGLAASSLPMAVMQVACMYTPKHNLFFHLGPAVVFTALVTAAGTFWYSRR